MSELDDLWKQLCAATDDEAEALDSAYQKFVNAGVLNKVVVHRYKCKKCWKVLATVIRVGNSTVARTTDYRYSQGMNQAKTVASGREKNTIDKHLPADKRHRWPGHTFDVDGLAGWGSDAGMSVACSHVVDTTILFNDVLAQTKDVTPGHPGTPTLL